MPTGSKTTTKLTANGSAKGKLVEGKYTEEQLFAAAETTVKKKTKDSKILDVEVEKLIPKFHERELELGRVLGRGGFCVVKDVTNVKLMKDFEDPGKQNDNKKKDRKDDENEIHDIIQDRAFIEAHCLRGKGKDSRYALKIMQESCWSDASTFINAIVDLAIEARFLSVIRHANIIKMRAMSVDTPYDSKFFVVLDRLYDILSTRLVKWKKQKPVGLKKLLDRGGKKEMEAFVERITFGYDLSCALKYLHESNIMYRDIKPDNIGFDIRGDIKLFDFGLVKEFDPSKRDPQGLFNLTEDTGSPRYMDPQVALGKPYNELCDVYSFSILLWQMLELDTPFEGFTMSMFTKKVVEGGARPLVNDKWSEELQAVMRKGWGPISKRPSMIDVCEVLREELSRLTDEDVQENTDVSRKSDMSSRGNMRKSVLSARALADARNEKKK